MTVGNGRRAARGRHASRRGGRLAASARRGRSAVGGTARAGVQLPAEADFFTWDPILRASAEPGLAAGRHRPARPRLCCVLADFAAAHPARRGSASAT